MIIEVATGLFFIYALFSLVASTANELAAACLKWRAKTLRKGICTLLHDPKGTLLAKTFYGHPLVRTLAEPRHLPSYIPSRTFAAALLDIVIKDSPTEDLKELLKNLPESELKETLLPLLKDSDETINGFKSRIELWFNDGMERVSGWYKRRAQFVLFFLGFFLVITFNVDTFEITRRLAGDITLRTALAAEARGLFEKNGISEGVDSSGSAGIGQEQFESMLKTLNQIGSLALPLGRAQESKTTFEWRKELKAHLPGWLISALAISLGAPFWFDLLNKIVNIMGVGKAPEEKQKNPKEVPQPSEPGVRPDQHPV